MNKKTVVLGFFDGLHPGHMSLINKAIECAGENACAYIFDRHPMQVLGKNVRLLMDFEQKKTAIKNAGIKNIITEHIDKAFLKLSPESFVKDIIAGRLDTGCVIVGENYSFGRDKSGDAAFLRQECEKYGISVICMPYATYEGEIISSTYIRGLIEGGDIRNANRLMALNYELCGKVVYGRQDGRKMGFPTANMIPPESRVIPPNGVYATITHLEGESYPSVTNIGYAPTFGENSKTIETNILGFDREIYGKVISVEFLDTIRFEKKFSSIKELTEQISTDVKRRMEK